MLQGSEALARRGKGGNLPASAFEYGDKGSAACFVGFDNNDFFVSAIHQTERLYRFQSTLCRAQTGIPDSNPDSCIVLFHCTRLNELHPVDSGNRVLTIGSLKHRGSPRGSSI